MNYNFDEIIDRRGTDSIKWDGLTKVFKRDDLLAMWVADMDFRTPPFVIESIQKQLNSGVLGYTKINSTWIDTTIQWLQKRFGITVPANEISFVPGIVHGIAFILQCFTNEGDKIAVHSPVYHPFFLVPQRNKRQVVFNPLVLKDGQYHIDFESFEKDIDGCKIFILSNPHNPGGRVWTKNELIKIAEICYDKHCLIISDEIHADLTLSGFKEQSLYGVSEKALQNSIIFEAPSKAFNMPGVVGAYSIIHNEQIRTTFNSYLKANELELPNMFFCRAMTAAYREGEDWLKQLIEYIENNINFTDHFLQTQIPEIKLIRPQASYLLFLDCRELKLTQASLVDLFVNKAHLGLNDGTMFGKEGEGFMRLNAGCPLQILKQALEQLKEAVAIIKQKR